jgi:hypothetical protein
MSKVSKDGLHDFSRSSCPETVSSHRDKEPPSLQAQAADVALGVEADLTRNLKLEGQVNVAKTFV